MRSLLRYITVENGILYLIHKKTQKNEVKFSEFGITKFNLVVFTISQWDLVLQLSIIFYLKINYLIHKKYTKLIETKVTQETHDQLLYAVAVFIL